jgi:hypothetical protein
MLKTLFCCYDHPRAHWNQRILNNDDNNDVEVEEEDCTPAEDSDHSVRIVAAASACRLIPISDKQRRSSVLQLAAQHQCTQPAKCSRLHKAQQPVAANAPGFLEASETVDIPPELTCLCQNYLAKIKHSFFIAATAHIDAISQVCGLSTEEMIELKGCVLLKRKPPKAAPCRHQTFSESSVHEMIKLGGNVPTNQHRDLICRFEKVLKKLQTQRFRCHSSSSLKQSNKK